MHRLRKTFFIMLFGTITLTVAPVQQAQSAIPILEIIRQGVKKVIKAVDLMIQRLQNKTIALQNAAKVLENKLSKLKLNEIAEWTERQRQLYKKYYDELWKVRNTLATYKRIKQILERQQQIIEEYRFTWRMINQDKHFTRSEIDYMYRVYTGILNESVYNLDQILLVINSFQTQMTDGKRLEVINKAGDNIEQNYADLKQFNNQNIQLSMNRAKDEHEVLVVKQLYGLE
ncbi:MAG TPA: conjugal transfer protein TraI [Cyclobacteriaceae bacterium]|nr:conjugal transfer protein TraI [Cyclobacteriaceae bacterium]HRF32960.1 conjugal transfer protein TraI [Cyclobacteriaceae bacterium]